MSKAPIIFITLGVFMLIIVGVLAAATSLMGSSTVTDSTGNKVQSYSVECTFTVDNPVFSKLTIKDYNCDYTKANCNLLSVSPLAFLGLRNDGVLRTSIAGIPKEQDYALWIGSTQTFTESWKCVPEGKTQLVMTLYDTRGDIREQQIKDINIIR